MSCYTRLCCVIHYLCNVMPNAKYHTLRKTLFCCALYTMPYPLLTCATGWSKETVDCNFLLTDPKISKSIITHWFLEILYREVLVFWCFNGVRCVEFCLFKHFQYRAFTAPYKAWTLQNTLLVLNTHPNPINIHTLHPYAHNHLLQVSRDNSGQQQTPPDTKRQSQAPQKTIWGCVAVQADIEWHLLVSVDVWRRRLVSYGVWRCKEGVWGVSQRVSECCLWAYLMFGFLQGSIWVFRLCMMQQSFYIGKSRKGKIPHTLHFSNIRIPKPPYISSLKIIRLLNFLNFLGLSEENYNLQSLWITLYTGASGGFRSHILALFWNF